MLLTESFKPSTWEFNTIATCLRAPVSQLHGPPAKDALSHTTELWTSRQQQHVSLIAEFSSDICHIAGTSNNVVVDLLFRTTLPNVAKGPAVKMRLGKALATPGVVKVL